MPMIVHDVSNEEDLGQRVTVEDTLQGMGLDIPKKYAYKRYGVQVPEEGEELLVRPAAPALPINTPAGPPDKPQFTAERERQVQAEIDAFDTLFGQLKDESQADYLKRITEIAKGAERANVRPGH